MWQSQIGPFQLSKSTQVHYKSHGYWNSIHSNAQRGLQVMSIWKTNQIRIPSCKSKSNVKAIIVLACRSLQTTSYSIFEWF
jgi:hypothetical protein